MRDPQSIPRPGCSGGLFSFSPEEVTTTRRTPNPKDFWKFTDEETETAKGTDLLEFNGKRSRDSPAPRPKSVQQEEKPVFALPIANRDQRRVFAYLQKRGIAAQVIRGFIDSGLLYEDSLHLVVASSISFAPSYGRSLFIPLLILFQLQPLRWVAVGFLFPRQRRISHPQPCPRRAVWRSGQSGGQRQPQRRYGGQLRCSR